LPPNSCASCFHRTRGLSAIVLRTSRFFPDEDDRKATRDAYEDDNVKANEFLYRRADIEDVVNAHLLALEKAPAIGFGRYIVSATTPFTSEDLQDLHTNAPAAVAQRVPGYVEVYARRGWSMFPHLDRVYVTSMPVPSSAGALATTSGA
jgi:UDP-glucose 4-epimerase